MEHRLYFGNIPFSQTEDDVRALFQACGKITELKIIKRSNISQGYGFITFEDKESVDEALKKNGHEVGGRTMKVNFAEKKTPDSGFGIGTETNRLFVKNIPQDTTEENIKEAFASYGKVTQVKFIHDHASGMRRGFGFVDLETHEQAKAALNMHDSTALGPDPLIVKPARNKESTGFHQWQNQQRGFYHPYQPYQQSYQGFNNSWQQTPFHRSMPYYNNTYGGHYQHSFNQNPSQW